MNINSTEKTNWINVITTTLQEITNCINEIRKYIQESLNPYHKKNQSLKRAFALFLALIFSDRQWSIFQPFKNKKREHRSLLYFSLWFCSEPERSIIELLSSWRLWNAVSD